ncbi:MAG: ACP S-malonyltransferase [Endomicrobiia bacterium]
MKLALVLPGQGAQTVGMGKDFYDNFTEIRDYYDKANDILGYDIKKLIFEGPQETLLQTNYTQPAIFLTSFVCYKILETKFPNIKNDINFVAGHSLGEYTALCVSGALNFEDTLKLVSIRGNIMFEVGKNNPGTMLAVLGMAKDELMNLCKDLSIKNFLVECVNFNCPGQIVVAGTISGIEELSKILTEKGIKNIKLNVSGAFHSSLMNEAQKNFLLSLDKQNLNNAFIDLVTNYDAKPHRDKDEIKQNLGQQINHPVLWEDSINYMKDKVDMFVECGPGRVLSGLIKKIDRKLNVTNIENISSLDNFIKIYNSN